MYIGSNAVTVPKTITNTDAIQPAKLNTKIKANSQAETHTNNEAWTYTFTRANPWT